MSEQPATSQDTVHVGWQRPPLTANALSTGTTEIHTTKKQACPECGERVQGDMETCAACGENLTKPPKPVHCMHCHTVASSELVLCPGCGRELREAPPKLVTYGAPALLSLLLVTVLVTQWERISPIAWARTYLANGVVLVENIGASVEPEMVIVMTPIVEEAASSSLAVVADANAVVSDTQVVAMAQASVVTPVPDPNVTEASNESILAAVAEESPIGVGGPQPANGEAALSAAAEAAPTEAPTATDTPLPTDTPLSPTPTATLAPTIVEAAAKAEGMAATLAFSEPTRTPTPTWTVVAAAVSTERSAATAMPTDAAASTMALVSTPQNEAAASGAVGGMAQVAALAANETTLPTPTPTETIVVTPLPTPTATPVVYQVRAGDTLVTIAAAYGVGVEELMAANDISEQDVYVIQPGQMLYIPVPTPEPASLTTGDGAAVRVEAPVLLVPTDKSVVGCATGGKLIWQRVQFIKDSDKYVLHLGFVSGQGSNGQESVTWVVAQNMPVTQTEWMLDTALCDLTPAEFGREWRWWVEVVEEANGSTVSVSPPSTMNGFIWQ